jgi:hypothetical protein
MLERPSSPRLMYMYKENVYLVSCNDRTHASRARNIHTFCILAKYLLKQRWVWLWPPQPTKQAILHFSPASFAPAISVSRAKMVKLLALPKTIEAQCVKRTQDNALVAQILMPNSKCHHGVWKQWCKPCGGSGYCQHGKNKYKCQECKDAGKPTHLCDHGKPQYCCAQCGTNRCQHGNIKRDCTECGNLCTHGKRKVRCAECGGGSLCTHGKRKDNSCQECARHIG